MTLKSTLFTVALVALAAAAGWMARGVTASAAETHVYELRTYHCEPGKLPNLLARFRDHTVTIFKRHGMKSVGYWVPADGPEHENTLVYMLEHKSRDAAKASWDAFRNDPEWVKVKTESEAAGKIVGKVDSVYLNPTDFSAIR